MLFIWRGLGILAPAVIFGTFIVVLAVGARVIPGDDPVPKSVIYLGWVLSAIINWTIGVALNQKEKAHTFYYIPIQFWSVVPVLILTLLLIFGE